MKKLGYSYKRARRSIKKRDQVLFEKAQEEIEVLKDKIDVNCKQTLYFFDESSFSLIPNIPYGWSPKKETIEIESKRSNALKVLGFLSLDNQLRAYTTNTTINSTLLIEVFNDFVTNLAKGEKATVILDNAPTHTSKAFQAQVPIWKTQGLTLYFLPPYSPELNRIEILWRFIKYHWINISDYASSETLENYIFKVLKNYGYHKTYEINFG